MDDQAQIAALRARVRELEERLEESESTLRAIQGGEVDALVIERDDRSEVFTLGNADRFYLRLATEVTDVGTWDWDLLSQQVTWSDGLIRLLGLPPDPGVASVERWNAHLHPEERERVWRTVQAWLEAGDSSEPYREEFRVVRADGEVRWLSSRGQVIRDGTGRPVRFVGINIDITDRVHAQEAQRHLAEVEGRLNRELREEARRKDEFLAMLAHELRNPLAALTNAIRLSRMPNLSERDRAWSEDVLDRQALQLGRILDDLLDVSRISTGKVQLKIERLRLQTVMGRAIENVRALVAEAGHALVRADRTEQDLWVDADPARLEQVLVNLLTNAIKYTNRGGEVRISCAQEGPAAAVVVADTGIGLSPVMLEKVFDLFAQAEQSLDRAQGGLGIGLTLVKRLCEMHGGTVTAASAGEGRGSEFTVRLPLVEAPAQEAAGAAREAPAGGGGRRVLIVDDNVDAAGILSMLLRMSGHNTLEAYDSHEALDLAREFRPEVALLDIGLPDIDGYQLARILRESERGPDMMLIAVSGYGQTEDRRRSQEAGFDHHFVKPVDHAHLLALLEAPQPR